MSDDLDRLDRLRDSNAALGRRAEDARLEAERQRKRADLAESRLRDMDPARTLRIEVTGEDVQAAAVVQADGDYWMRSVLECFAARLAARQWVEVPAEATIPEGMPYRVEYRDGSATEWFTAINIAPGQRNEATRYLVPADRLSELTYPDPDADLIAKLADAEFSAGRVEWPEIIKIVREHDRQADHG